MISKTKKSFFESSNPMLNETALSSAAEHVAVDGEKMTVSGAVNKTLFLGAIMLIAAVVSYTFASPLFTFGGAIGALILVFVISAKTERAPRLAPWFAVLEGLFVGGISAMYASLLSGIVLQAVTLTFAIFFGMLFIYKAGIIKVTKSFRTGVTMATIGVLGLYLVSFVMSLFGVPVPFLHEASPITLIICLAILAIASLNLLLDFDQFDKGEQLGAPAHMEWFAAMGLIITMVWIYVQLLRILAIFSGRD